MANLCPVFHMHVFGPACRCAVLWAMWRRFVVIAVFSRCVLNVCSQWVFSRYVLERGCWFDRVVVLDALVAHLQGGRLMCR